MLRNGFTFALIVVMAGALNGCATKSTAFPYQHTADDNLIIDVSLKASGLKSISGYVVIENVEQECLTEYRGYVDLVNGKNNIGIPTGKPIHLRFGVNQRIMSNYSSVQKNIGFTPKTGKKYEIVKTYADNMFDIRLYEVSDGTRKELTLTPFTSCGRVNRTK